MTAERYISQYAQEFMKLDRKFWNYEDGCVLTGLEAMYKATGRKCYAEAVRVFLDRYICPDGRIRWYDREEYSLDKIPSGPRPALSVSRDRTGEVPAGSKAAYGAIAASAQDRIRKFLA